MGCELGFDNPDCRGGKYVGKEDPADIRDFMEHYQAILADDGISVPSKWRSHDAPNITPVDREGIDEDYVPGTGSKRGKARIWAHREVDEEEENAMIDLVSSGRLVPRCFGYGLLSEEDGWTGKCEGCRYLTEG